MRFSPSLLVLVFALSGSLPAQIVNNDPIFTVGTIPSQTIKATLGSTPIVLSNYFAVPNITDQVVQFTTPGVGVFNVVMDSAVAPNTVTNFLTYVNTGSFTNSLIHRSVPVSAGLGFDIIQGGSYFPNTNGTVFQSYNTIATYAPIALEAVDNLANKAGTIAMTRVSGDLNSATSGWFINTVDNSTQFLPASNQASNSYAAFGRVTGTGMTVVNALAALPVLYGNVTVTSSNTSSNSLNVALANLPPSFGPGWSLLGATVTSLTGTFVSLSATANATISVPTPEATSLYGSPFDQLPVLGILPANQTASVNLNNLVQESSITAVSVFPATAGGPAVVTFSAASSNPGLVNATISGSNLNLTAAKNLPGTSQVTVTATDSNGNAVSQTAFTVTVQREAVDYNGNSNNDSNTDLIFQNAIGQIIVWYMNASGVQTGANWISTGAAGDWVVVGVADMNNDDIPDLVFQNTLGQIIVWYMDATGARTAANWLSTGAAGDWRVVGVADMNNDGNNDLVFQNNIGQIIAWYMDGAGNRIGAHWISTGAAGDWRVSAIGDMNSDGNADLIFQNTIGQIIVWYMDGAGKQIGANWISTGASGPWKVMRVADLNYDGNNDIIFQNPIGQIIAWYMDGTGNRIGANWISTGAAGTWRVR